MISFPQSEGVSKFLPLGGCFSGNELCLYQKLNVRLTCPDIFQGQRHYIFIPMDQAHKNATLIFWSLQEKAFLWQWMKTKERWKESFLKRNKKANTKGCINAESVCVCVYWGRGRGWGDALYLDWELRRSEARRPIVSLEEHWSFGRKATFECSMNKTERHDVSILWVFQKNPVGRLCMDTRLSALCLSQRNKHHRNKLETSP